MRTGKFEIPNPKSENRLPIDRLITDVHASKSGASRRKSFGFRISGFGFRAVFRRFREPANIEQTAARTRAERLFAVNFRSTWNR
jgi:hypothetical protein